MIATASVKPIDTRKREYFQYHEHCETADIQSRKQDMDTLEKSNLSAIGQTKQKQVMEILNRRADTAVKHALEHVDNYFLRKEKDHEPAFKTMKLPKVILNKDYLEQCDKTMFNKIKAHNVACIAVFHEYFLEQQRYDGDMKYITNYIYMTEQTKNGLDAGSEEANAFHRIFKEKLGNALNNKGLRLVGWHPQTLNQFTDYPQAWLSIVVTKK